MLRIIACVLLLISLLSMVDSNEWWIRVWDFPRVQILAVILLVIVLLIAFDSRLRWWLAAPLVITGGWQLHRVYPYTPLATPEVALTNSGIAGDQCFSVLSYNVLQDNRDYGPSLAMLRETNPDILLLLETDAGWQQALEPILSRYPTRIDQPLGNTYGLIFATRLPAADARIEDLAEPETPSVTARLTAGAPFRLIGLHPRPPQPGQDTEERDAEIIIAAIRAARHSLPTLAIGDFNDVAWSDTSHKFKRVGGFLDPRIGRGPSATFPAQWPWLAWPLDHLFITPEFTLRKMRVLGDYGSDHRPIYSELCLTRQDGPARNAVPDTVSPEDHDDAVEVLNEYREDQADEARGGERPLHWDR